MRDFKVLNAISYEYSIEMMEALQEERRFTELEEETGLNSNTVNMRLKDLAAADLVEKRGRKYVLTEKGGKALALAKELRTLDEG